MKATWRIAFVGLALIAMLGVLGLRLWVVQVTAAVEYQEQAAQNQIRLVSTPAPRGDIYDRNGTLLAGTRPSLAAVVDLALVADEDREELVSRLAALFDIPASSITERFDSAASGARITLADGLSQEEALLVMERREDFPGVSVIPQPVRFYPLGDNAAHILGYIGKPSSEDLEREGVRGTDTVGKAGVERQYDDSLRGIEGRIKYRIDARGNVLESLGEQDPEGGGNLILTIDADIQAQLQKSLEDGLTFAREVEMDERREALAQEDMRTRLFVAREEAQLELYREAISEGGEGDEDAASIDEVPSEVGDIAVEIDEGEVLGSLYPGLPIDEEGICIPFERVPLELGIPSILSGTIGRSVRLDSIDTDRRDPIAGISLDGERHQVSEGDSFGTTLRVVTIEDDRVVLSHSDKWCPVRAVGVVEDPQDGSVLAMASYPSFDPNAFIDGLSQDEWESLGTGNAFTNFAVQGLYSPASTFKAVAYMAAIEEGIYPIDRPVDDRVVGGSSETSGAEAADGEPGSTIADGESGSTVADGETDPEGEGGEIPADGGDDSLIGRGDRAPRSEGPLLPLTSDTDPYNCTGSLRFEFNDGSSQVYRDWKKAGHGPLDLHGALQASCDLYFWEIALRIWNERDDAAGINNEDLWQEWARAFGFDEKTGVDLPFEKEGLIPDRQWFREEQRKGSGRVREVGPWVGGDLMNAVVGQGEVLVTPLQLTNAFSAMVNGGTLWEPRVISRIVDEHGATIGDNPASALGTIDLSEETVALFLRDLQQVANGPIGTATKAFADFGLNALKVGGKTGTAEIIKATDDVQEVDSAWFVGVAPINDPQYVMTVVVERGGSGGKVAAPVARQVLQFLLNGPRGVRPLEAGANAD
jgi:cell division protein FtsI/penicillin-binding protein 2